MNTKKSIQVINSLIEINHDRIEGYKSALTETKDKDLIALFQHFMSSSAKCKEELVAEVQQLGGMPEEDAAMTGRFFKPWMGLTPALNNNDRKAVLNACTHGEDQALELYNNVLTNDVDFLTIEQHKMIYKQYVMLKTDHDKMKSVRDMELEPQH